MKKRTILKSFFMMFFLVMFLVLITVQPSVSEMTLNDNVNIEGDIFLNGTGGGINFPDGSEQRTAAKTSWSKIITTDRFELVLGGGAVLDHETGLVWQKDADDNMVRDWHLAQTYCYRLVIGGRGGWRLPTVDELTTLIDYNVPYSVGHPRLPAGHPFVVLSSYYWSSTTYANNTGYAWLVGFDDGYVGGLNKANSYYVRAVRSGQ